MNNSPKTPDHTTTKEQHRIDPELKPILNHSIFALSIILVLGAYGFHQDIFELLGVNLEQQATNPPSSKK